jgi:Fe-S-cluster-containing hydrogenase component 2
MIVLKFLACVDEEKCRGCKQCALICPAGAIEVADKKARVDGGRCIDCQRCIDRCNKQNAIARIARPKEVIRRVDYERVDRRKVQELCARAHLFPEMPLCSCNNVLAREAAAAVLQGAKTPEDVCAMTGMRAGCGIYCMVTIFELLQAHGLRLETPKDNRWYSLPLSLYDLPEDIVAAVDEKYPQYYLREDWSFRQGKKAGKDKSAAREETDE